MRRLAHVGQAILPVVIALLTGGIACPPAAASLTPMALTGRVTSANAPLAGVTVTITSPSLQRERTTVTNNDGRYFFAALPPGRYEVVFSKSAHTSLARPVVVELGRVARADAVLNPSADEESVTSTAVPIAVTETTAITTHFSDVELDRLPLPLDRVSAYTLAPHVHLGGVLIDDAPFSAILGYEGVEELTVFRGAYPIELDTGQYDLVSARTRSGGEQFTLSLRDTYSRVRGRGGHLLELASGGRIVRERLWFFAAGWGGDLFGLEGLRGVQLKLTGQPGAAHNVVANWIRSDENRAPFASDPSLTALRYTGVFGSKVTAEAALSDATPSGFLGGDLRTGTARVSWLAGNHVLTGGASHTDTPFFDTTMFFLGDRWSRGRFTVDAGVRHSDGESFAPRVAATYDVAGNGRHAIAASWSDYGLRMATLGYAAALGNSGRARIDYVHRWGGGTHIGAVEGEARYRLFDRFEAGGTYVWSTSDEPFYDDVQIGRAWVGLQLPLGEQELGATILQRYDVDQWVTDVALRWSLPLSRAGLTVGVDSTNVLGTDVFLGPRTWRFWARIRI